METLKRIKTFFSDNKCYKYYSFLISSILMFVIFMFNKMNGSDFLVIRSDYLDGIGFYKDLIRSIINHESLFFTFSSGLGSNNIMFMSGVFSPFNLLYLIFKGVKIDIVTLWIIILKVGLAAFSFNLFSEKILKNNSFFSIIISVFYSLNAFSIEYGTIHISWLDALFVLPILCISIVDCIEHNKRVLLIVCYSYIFISNYYIGYMVSGFSLLFFVFYMILIFDNKEGSIKIVFSKISNWILSVLISIMLSAFIWVPTLFFVASNRVPDSTAVEELNVSLFQILNSLYWGMDYGIGGFYAYIYCGIPMIILSPLFFFNKNINIKEKWFYGIITFIIFISMVSVKMNSVWHAFDQPDDFWYRYSFVLCFWLCALSSRQIVFFEKNCSKILIYVIFGLLLFYQFILHTIMLWEIDDAYLNTNYGFMINMILIIIWSGIIYFSFCKKKFRVLCVIVSLSLMSFELISYSKRQFNYLTDAATYNEWLDLTGKMVNEIQEEDNDFYRIIISQNNIGYNMDTNLGYFGIGDFGNQEKYAVRKFMSNIGFGTAPRITLENGYNPVSNMILGVRYKIEAPFFELISDDDNLTYEEINEIDYPQINSENKDLMQNDSFVLANNPHFEKIDYYLNIGYLVEGNSIIYEYPGRNVFENTNELLTVITGIEKKCFVPVSMDDITISSNNIDLAEMDSGDFVFTRTSTEGEISFTIPSNGYEEAYIQFEEESPAIYRADYYISDIDKTNIPNSIGSGLGVSSSIKMIPDENGDTFSIKIISDESISPELFSCQSINIAYLDEEVLKDFYSDLKKNQLYVQNYSNGNIEGKIHVEGNRRLLFTTIPYDPGWKVYINGIETEAIRLFDGAFIGIYLPYEGDFNISLKYECPGLKIGAIVSLCGILALLSVVFEKKLKKQK